MTQAYDESSELPEGLTLLDRYTIIDRIAGGGMATIYRATDERLDRVVCVKLLRLIVESSGSTSNASGSVYQATYSHFLKEALALSKLSHPNTLRIYDFGYLDEYGLSTSSSMQAMASTNPARPFQVSEFLDGGNLEQQVRARGALGPQEAVSILERMGGAVSEAHGHGIIHRDIKPSNILFARIGTALMPKLADFGIARCDLRKRPRPGEDEDETFDQPVNNIPLFSPRWAAPEQLSGVEEGPYTDVYALGLVAAFMLAGVAPFDIDDVRSTFTDRVHGDDFLTSRLVALGFAPDVRRVMLAAMRAEPRSRTPTPAGFIEELTRVLQVGGGVSVPPSSQAKSKKPSRDSITLEAVISNRPPDAPTIVPQERIYSAGRRQLRVVEVNEKLDLAVPTVASSRMEIRFRVSLVPSRNPRFRVHLKGLNCFVARVDVESKRRGAPSPALVADFDGRAEFISTTRESLGEISWYFGHTPDHLNAPEATRLTPNGLESACVFHIEDAEMMVPFPLGHFGLALDLGENRDLIVISRRP